jgi:hypothetical protein
MALVLNSASPSYKPYVNAPGANPAAAARFTKAAQTFYPATYGGVATPAAASPGAVAPPPPSSGPDYGALLANDPILGQALAGFNAQGVQNKAALTAQQQRALIQYGRVPSLDLSAYGASIDPTTAQLAAQNTAAGTSTVANLQRAYQLAQQGSDASLAARGMLRSGAYGQHSAENLQGYNTAGYQADQQLMDYLQGLYSGYLQQQQGLQSQGASATSDALSRLIQQIQAGQITGGQAPPPPPQQWGLPPGQSAPDLSNVDLSGWVPPAPPTSFTSAVPVGGARRSRAE